MSARDPLPPLREGDGPEVLSLRRRLRRRGASRRWLTGLASLRWWFSALALAAALTLVWPGSPVQGDALGAALGMTLPDLRRDGYGPEVLTQMAAALRQDSLSAQAHSALGAYRALGLVLPVLYALAALAWLARAGGRRRMPLGLLALPVLTGLAALGENLGLAWQLWGGGLTPAMTEAVCWAGRAKWWLILLLLLTLSAIPAWPRHGRRRLDQLLR